MSQDKHRALPLLPLGALAAGFGLAGMAAAQTPPAAPAPATPASAPADTKDTVLPTVKAKASAVRQGKDSVQATTTSIGKGTQELRDIPQSVTVVTERLIDDRNLDTLKEALHNTAGISFQAAEGGEEDIRLRGFSLNSTGDIFIDGIRDPAFYERDTFNVDRLEVLRGSASVLFGRGSTGGAVNQVNKQPLLFGRNEVDLTLGSGRYARATADLNVRTGENAALRVNVMKTDADQWGNFIDKEGLAATFAFGIGTRDEFSAGIYHLDNHNGVHYGMPWLAPTAGSTDRVLVPADPKNYYGAASDYSAGGADYATLSHIHRFGLDGELKTVLRVAKFERDLRASAVRFCTRNATTGANPECPATAPALATINANTILTRGNNNKIQDLDTVQFQSDYSGRFTLGGIKNALQAGVDASKEEFTNFGAANPPGVTITKPKTTLGTPNDGGSVDEALRVLSVNRTFEAKAFGLYAQNLMQLHPQWKLLTGLRWDRFEGDYNTPQIGTTAPTQRARSDSLWSKRIGVLYQPSAFQSYHLSYGTSFNTSGDTYQYDALSSNTPPEGSRNFELGGKLDLADGNLSLRFALFHAVKTNERNRDELTVNATNYVLSGQRHAAGIELDVAGRIAPAWEVFASYAFIPDAEIDKASSVNGTTLQGERVGARPGGTPKHSGTVWTTYKLGSAWRVGGGINVRSADAPPLVETFKAPAYTTGDLMAEYVLKDLSFKLNVTNVTNKLYADILYRGHYIPGKPRTVQLTTSYRF
ncbi:TonB-dependent siderophore receptor [Aquincola sp. S2]|uniref:TonB-dependent siderophore receptor n=1 Tax=Pseudaquabacterium terrae TaxID=2732868 RepID=A0ABX2ECE2_9BURK|nr:TonB-dependent siderophore receptor [Aquabacterium terrae]NRF66104.1 TonB-dependent siderophore receptor [Aquabacterium terrae]